MKTFHFVMETTVKGGIVLGKMILGIAVLFVTLIGVIFKSALGN